MVTKLRLVFSITILFLSFYGLAQDGYWKKVDAQSVSLRAKLDVKDITKGMFFSLDEKRFKNGFQASFTSKNDAKRVYFPDEKGNQVAYEVLEKSVLAPELAKKFPNIKSYAGYEVNNRQNKIRFSVSHNGIQSMVIHTDSHDNTFIEKISEDKYVVYSKSAHANKNSGFTCSTVEQASKKLSASAAKPVDDQLLRKFRLAVSASGEYTTFHGGTVADAMAAINATVTRINEVFETDLGVTLELVANNDLLIYTDAATDPYGNGGLNSDTQTTLTATIGEENYDIGHLFHEALDNGNAGGIGTVCRDNIKGSAFSSSTNPQGDKFDLEFVAHEMGHQLGANHTWSFESEGTVVQVEPASGTTIMGYAGITNGENVTSNGEEYFHYSSIVQIADYLEGVGCAEITALTNTPPVIVPGEDYAIPKGTAFVLSGEASDVDVADVLTYAWEQIDNGIVTTATFGPNNPAGANFRSLRPSINPERYFPKLESVLSGNLTQTNPPENSAWETVSNVPREMNFAFTVRDNAIGGGQVVSDLINLTVIHDAGPFVVTSQQTNESIVAGDIHTLTWDVANTNMAPINANNVDILLSTDGGITFPIMLADDVLNSGSYNVIIPGVETTSARIMIKASDNVFFAVNDSDFTITESQVVLNFETVDYEVCQPNDVIIPFVYETYSGFAEESTFSVVNLPTGLSATFSPVSTSLNNTSVNLTISGTTNVATGSYSLEINSSAASVTKNIEIELQVFDSNYSDVVVSSPLDGSVDVSTNTALEWEEIENYSSYDVEIARDNIFADIIESATVYQGSYEPLNLESEQEYFWRIKPKNSCGEGIFGSSSGFTTVQVNCQNRAAEDLPLEIPSLGTPTVLSKVVFSEDLILADVNVNVEISHNYLFDLVISLISPSGTTVILTSNSCGDLKNINATFDDEATSAFVCSGNPGISGTVRPLGSLDVFKGESIMGEWTLQVFDTASSDGGTINGFSLDMCVEGQFRPDADQDGVFDDGPDLCLDTPIGQEVDITGCPVYRFASDNFTLKSQSESCRENNDGAIEITTKRLLTYEVVVQGNGINSTENFNDNYLLRNLSAGTYSVCITATDGMITYEEICFEAVVTEPETLQVASKISLNESLVELDLRGASLYNIELNGGFYQTTQNSESIDLKKGENTLKVSTGLECQGVYEEVIYVASEAVMYPNPFANVVKLYLGEQKGNLKITVFSSNGQLVKSRVISNHNVEVILDFAELPSGIYSVKYENDEQKGVARVIKL